MPINIALAKTDDIKGMADDLIVNFAVTFTDPGLRICSNNLREDREVLLTLLSKLVPKTASDRVTKERFRREIDQFKTRAIKLSQFTDEEFIQAADLFLCFGFPDGEVMHGGLKVPEEKISDMQRFHGHESYANHLAFLRKDTDLKSFRLIVQTALATALQGQGTISLYDPYFSQWLLEEQNEKLIRSRELSAMAIRFLAETWLGPNVVAPEDKRIRIYSRIPKRLISEEAGVRANFNKFERFADVPIPIDLCLWGAEVEHTSPDTLDRFLQAGDWVFSLLHGLDYMGYLADDVQVSGDSSLYVLDGRPPSEKKDFNIFGPDITKIELLARLRKSSQAI